MTQSDAIIAIERMVESIPESMRDSKDFGFLVSLEISQHLHDYASEMAMRPPVLVNKGDNFTWRGVNCKVA